MATHQHTLNVPLELLEEIFEHLMAPYDCVENECPPGMGEEREGMVALVKCAQACRDLQKPALKVLWKVQSLTRACCAPLHDSAGLVGFKGPDEEEDEPEGEGGDGNDWTDMNLDDSLFNYTFLDGPLKPAQWTRFKFYAQFVRVLYYTIDENINPTVFFFLQQHSRGEPLFPNLRTITWSHAVPEILSVLSPTVQNIYLMFHTEEEENYGEPQELAYRMRRHTFKILLPSMLTMLPRLRHLDMRPLRHEEFWLGFQGVLSSSRVTHSLRILDITESVPVLLCGALPVASMMRGLEEMRITADGPRLEPSPSQLEISRIQWPKALLRPFDSLRTVHISSGVASVAYLVDIIEAPCLETAVLYCSRDGLDSGFDKLSSAQTLAALHCALHILSTRNTHTLQTVGLSFEKLWIPERVEPDNADSAMEERAPSSSRKLIEPLLALRHLRQLEITMPRNPAGAPVDVPVPGMLAAWPMLEHLDVSDLALSPDFLQTVARTCPRLRRLRAMRLADNFLKAVGRVTPCQSTVGEGHPLEVLCLHVPDKIKEKEDVLKTAGFVHSLFPRLHAQECQGRRCHHGGHWLEVLEEITRLQNASTPLLSAQ